MGQIIHQQLFSLLVLNIKSTNIFCYILYNICGQQEKVSRPLIYNDLELVTKSYYP